MVTSFPYYPEWQKRDGDRGRLFRTDALRGVQVHRCWHYVPEKPAALKRILHELTFVVTSFLRVLMLPQPAAYVVVSPPLLLGAAAWLAGVLKRAPFIFHVQDMQPDAAARLGMVHNPQLLGLLYALEAFAYRKATRISGITAGMLAAFQQKGVPPEKTMLFANGVELPEPGSLPPPGRFRQQMGIGAREVLAVYAGNLGVKQGVEILLEAARFVSNGTVRFVICGDGARRAVLEQRARHMGLSNVIFLPLMPEQAYLEMLVDADIYLVTQQPGAGALFFPSKLLKGLALSKAVLVVADDQSELTRAAAEGAFAIVVAPKCPEKLAAALKYLCEDSESRKTLGLAGRRYVERFELKRLLQSFAEALSELAPQPELQTRPAPLPARAPAPGSPVVG
jgi:colanic acid biosynthesis glycosyl transferase WcaI